MLENMSYYQHSMRRPAVATCARNSSAEGSQKPAGLWKFLFINSDQAQ